MWRPLELFGFCLGIFCQGSLDVVQQEESLFEIVSLQVLFELKEDILGDGEGDGSFVAHGGVFLLFLELSEKRGYVFW